MSGSPSPWGVIKSGFGGRRYAVIKVKPGRSPLVIEVDCMCGSFPRYRDDEPDPRCPICKSPLRRMPVIAEHIIPLRED